MKLVSNWREAWKWHSTQLLALIAALPAVWVSLPPDIKAAVPDEWMPWLIGVMAVGAIVGRVRDQSSS